MTSLQIRNRSGRGRPGWLTTGSVKGNQTLGTAWQGWCELHLLPGLPECSFKIIHTVLLQQVSRHSPCSTHARPKQTHPQCTAGAAPRRRPPAAAEPPQ